jgi:hypothetical protein
LQIQRQATVWIKAESYCLGFFGHRYHHRELYGIADSPHTRFMPALLIFH